MLRRMKVHASVKLISDDYNQKIGEFDLEVGGFVFHRVSDSELRVDFAFETDPIVEEEGIGKVFEVPHQDNQDLMQKETELDSLLDLLSISEDIHLRIDHDSYSFTYENGSIGSSVVTGNELRFDGDGQLIGEMFDNLKASGDEIIDSLRFYRLSKLEFDGGEQAVQLWNIVERLYGEQPHDKYLSKGELAEAKTFLVESSIPESKHEKIMAALNGIHPVSVRDLYAGKIQLRNNDGTIMSLEDKKKMFGVWKDLRNYHGHGTYILRNPELELELIIISDTVKLFLEGKVLPRLYHVVMFKTGSLAEAWQNSPSTVSYGEWHASYSRGSDKGLVHILENTLHDGVRVYVVYPNRVIEVKKGAHVEIDLEKIPDEVRRIATDIRSDMYRDSEIASGSKPSTVDT